MIKEVMQIALDALDNVYTTSNDLFHRNACDVLLKALAQPEPEPVAWLYTNKLGGRQVSLIDPPQNLKEEYQPLYTISPQANHFNPDWDAIPVMVEEQQRMAKRIEELKARPKLRRGDVLRCIETNDLCTVWATSTTGKMLVKWKANDFGNYTAEQIGNLFWVEPKQTEPQREWQGLTEEEMRQAAHAMDAEPLAEGWKELIKFARAIEAKLKDKNI